MLLYASLGEKYGMLPSQVAKSANLLDLMCYDVMSSWSRYHSLDDKGKMEYKAKSLSQEQLSDLLNRTKRK